MDRNFSQELLSAIERADRAGAAAVVEAWALDRPFSQVVPELLAPTLEAFGKRWAQGQGGVSLATGYVASKVAEDVLSRLLRASTSTAGIFFSRSISAASRSAAGAYLRFMITYAALVTAPLYMSGSFAH